MKRGGDFCVWTGLYYEIDQRDAEDNVKVALSYWDRFADSGFVKEWRKREFGTIVRYDS